jgi:hypothetical protein
LENEAIRLAVCTLTFGILIGGAIIVGILIGPPQNVTVTLMYTIVGGFRNLFW